MLKIIVIGGGAAGFFAAIQAARMGGNVVLLEKSNKVLSKVKVSGGGRCNVTNSCTDPHLLIRNYPRGSKELLSAFTRFGSIHTVSWFEDEGVQLKTEPDGRMFPVSNTSQTIIDCLVKAANSSGVVIKYHAAVKKMEIKDGEFLLSMESGELLISDKVIIATGGSPLLKNYLWLEEIGHTIISPVPSLFTFNIPDNPFLDLMGLSVPEALIKIAGTSFNQTGPVLFTHWGISGPAILKLSAWAARWLESQQYDFTVIINSFPDLTEQQLKEDLIREMQMHQLKKVTAHGFKKIPLRLWERFCFMAGIRNDQRWNETSKKSINKLLQLLTSLEMHVKGKTTFKEEFVTCGGVSLKEVNMKTMESKLVPGLYFAGEVLDIDGVTGGFNFQAAWTTGFVSGVSSTAEG